MEAKATEAEQQIVELKKRVSALESGENPRPIIRFLAITHTSCVQGGSYEAKKEILENVRAED